MSRFVSSPCSTRCLIIQSEEHLNNKLWSSTKTWCKKKEGDLDRPPPSVINAQVTPYVTPELNYFWRRASAGATGAGHVMDPQTGTGSVVPYF